MSIEHFENTLGNADARQNASAGEESVLFGGIDIDRLLDDVEIKFERDVTPDEAWQEIERLIEGKRAEITD